MPGLRNPFQKPPLSTPAQQAAKAKQIIKQPTSGLKPSSAGTTKAPAEARPPIRGATSPPKQIPPSQQTQTRPLTRPGAPEPPRSPSPSSASSRSGTEVSVVDRGTSPTRPPSPASSVGRGASVVTEEEVAGEEVAAEAAGIGATEVVPVVGTLVAIGLTAAAVVGGIINNDNNKREAYTQQFIQQASKQFPNCNWVICHPQHSVTGPHVVHQHHELGMTVGTCGYDSYCSPKGQPFTFNNQGDGGYLNWAYAGKFSRNGNKLTAA